MDLFLGQFDAGVYQIANLVQESLGRVCGPDVTDSSLLEKIGAASREAVFRHTVGAEVGAKPSIGPGKVGS